MIIALDPGFGNTKVCFDGQTSIIQTAVARPHAIGLAATGLRLAGHIHTVEFADGQRFIVGPRAWLHGEPLSSLDYSAMASPERRALFYAALAGLTAIVGGEHTIDQLVVGLPVSLLQDRPQAEQIFAALRAYKGLHEFTVDEHMPTRLEIGRITVLAQPVGAYADWLIDSDLAVRKGWKASEVAVLDIGLNTLDLYALRGGEVEPRFVGGAKVGVRRLLASIDGDQEIEESDASLRSGVLHANVEQMTAWLGEMLAVVERSWPKLSRFNAVIPTGGGALVLGDLLRNELARRGAAVAWPEDPISANVRGLWKWYARKEKVAEPEPVKVVAKRRGRPPGKSGPYRKKEKCSKCGLGMAGEGGICTSCRNQEKQDNHKSETDQRIDAIVKRWQQADDAILERSPNPVKQVRNGETIGGSRLG